MATAVLSERSAKKGYPRTAKNDRRISNCTMLSKDRLYLMPINGDLLPAGPLTWPEVKVIAGKAMR